MIPNFYPVEGYNEKSYHDLKIQLSDDTVRYVSKNILCGRNAHFAKLCPPVDDSNENTRSVITLEDDDPLAMDAVLRFIYRQSFVVIEEGWMDWRSLLNLYVAAKKYGESQLEDEAEYWFSDAVRKCKDPNEIVDILEAIETMSLDGDLSDCTEILRKENLQTLLKNERFRNRMGEAGKGAMWELISEMSEAVRSGQETAMQLRQKVGHLEEVLRTSGVSSKRRRV